MTNRQTFLRLGFLLFLALGGGSALGVATSVADPMELANGIRGNLYSADELAGRLTREGARGTILLPDGSALEVITDINDPLIANKGDGRFHPYDVGDVIRLLGEIDFPGLDLTVDIYILPFPRAQVLASSTVGRRVFLSPHVEPVSTQGAAYTIAHEIGHVFQHRYLPRDAAPLWQAYRRARGIDDAARFSSRASHPYRPAEIFAEDFRVLFGGPAAYFDGRVENPELPSPVGTAVEAFFRRLPAHVSRLTSIDHLTSYPNPFNPVTEIRVVLSEAFVASGETLTIRVYDVRGALVRELFSGRAESNEVRVRWDGRDRNGRDVASATYFGVVAAGTSRMTQKLIMIK